MLYGLPVYYKNSILYLDHEWIQLDRVVQAG